MCARGAKSKAQSFEDELWKITEELKGDSINTSDYKFVVLNLFFLKYANVQFNKRREEIVKDYGKEFVDLPDFYESKRVSYLPKEARWDEILDRSYNSSLARSLDEAFSAIEESNPKKFEGILEKDFFQRKGLKGSNLRSLLDKIWDKFDGLEEEGDVFGRIYQFFLHRFALDEGSSKSNKKNNEGEFYTPPCIVKLMVSLIEPYKGKVYDPCCGSGGMFVHSAEFVQANQGDWNISIYGQELKNLTYGLAKINLAIRGIEITDLGRPENTLTNDQHRDLKAKFILANPPFNQSKWRAEDSLIDDVRWQGYEVPPSSGANYAWILHILYHLSNDGVAAFLISNIAVSSNEKKEKAIRRQLIENDLIEAIIMLPSRTFFNTSISVTLWIMNRDKSAKTVEVKGVTKSLRSRENEILFMDLRNMGSPSKEVRNLIELSPDDIKKITNIFHSWRSTEKEQLYQDQVELCASKTLEDVREQDYNLSPAKYIAVDETKGLNTNWEEEIKTLTEKLNNLFSEEQEAKDEIQDILKNLKI